MSATFEIPVDQVVAWRRHLHQNPELSFREHRTADFIVDQLTDMGLEVSRPTETSVLAKLVGTGESGRTVAWRADIDALPLTEETGEPFSSNVPGVMHACGHDGHAAMALGAAKVLSEAKDRVNGTVYFLFQHAEEQNPGGAIQILESGALADVQAIYAIHVMNQKLGTLSIHKGPASTSAGGAFVTIKGQGSHGSMPQNGIDPVLTAAQSIVALNTITSRNLDPANMNIVNVGMVQSGQAPNVIPDTARLGVSLRTAVDDDYETMVRRTEEIVHGIAAANGAKAEFQWVPTYSVVVNDDELCDIAYEAAGAVLPEGDVFWGPATSASEDFSAYTKVMPGAFLLLGAGTAEDGLPFMNHHPKFNINEACLETGVQAAVAILLGYLNK